MMRKLLIIIMMMLVANTCFAASQNGGLAAPVTYWGVGARSLSMGRVGLTTVNDGTASFVNPAMMSTFQKKTFSSMYSSLLGISQYTYLGGVWPMIGNETFGAHLISLSSDGFIKTEYVDGVATESGSFPVSQMSMGFSYARQLNESLSLGLASSYYTNTVDESVVSSILFDASGYYKLEDVTLGFVLKNILAFNMGEVVENAPMVFQFGGSTKFLEDQLLVELQATQISGGEELEFGVGGEYKLFDDYYARAGLNSGDIFLGAGMEMGDISFDSALHFSEVDSEGESGSELTYVFSFDYVFGSSKIEERKEQLEKHVELLNKGIKDGNFKKAYKAGVYVLKLDSTDKDAQQKVKKLKVLNDIHKDKASQQTYTTEKVRTLLKIAGIDYMEGNPQKSINKLKYLLFLQPEYNEVSKQFLAYLIDSNKEEDLEGKDIVGEKLKESLVNFYGSDFAKVLDNCNEILELDSENIDAYLRKGSAYFMMMQEEKAIEEWKKVLEVDPNRKDEIEMIIQNLKKTRRSSQDQEDSVDQAPVFKGISLGTYKSQSAAGKVKRTLRKKGFNAQVSKMSKGGKTLYRLYVSGKGMDQSKLQEIFNALRKQGYKTYWMK